MSSKKADTAVDELRDDVARTREDLGGTVGALADKADVKKRAAGKARQAKARGQETVEELGESTRRHPVRWGGLAAGLLAAVGAIGTLRWRRSRQPKSRAERMWRGVKNRAKDARKGAKRTARQMKGRLSR